MGNYYQMNQMAQNQMQQRYAQSTSGYPITGVTPIWGQNTNMIQPTSTSYQYPQNDNDYQFM